MNSQKGKRQQRFVFAAALSFQEEVLGDIF
jgi:hypothetical protein